MNSRLQRQQVSTSPRLYVPTIALRKVLRAIRNLDHESRVVQGPYGHYLEFVYTTSKGKGRIALKLDDGLDARY